MNDQDLGMMSIEELWALHEEICAILSTKLDAKRLELERRLALLGRSNELNGHNKKRVRQPYLKVLPKYQNPDRPLAVEN
jgi:DNA-binding protein H-NS